MSPSSNPWASGLLVPIGAADQVRSEHAAVTLGGKLYDARPYFQAFTEIGSQLQSFARSPYNIAPIANLQRMTSQIAPHISSLSRQGPAVREVMAPMVSALANFAAQSKKLVGMRMKTQIHISRAPKILIPISMSIAAGGTLAGVQVRNPYLGATGGGTDGGYQYPWAITSFRTSNNENGQLQDKRITQFLLGGHDYVSAALGGLTYTAGGAPATQGWPAAAFTETKRSRWQTEVQPWTTVANHGAGVGWGSVMTETGFLQVAIFNGSAGTYTDTYSVYANATLCGNPFTDQRFSQTSIFKSSFVPLALQAPMAMRLAMDASKHIGQVVAQDDNGMNDLGPLQWLRNTDRASQQLAGLLGDSGLMVDVGDPVDPNSVPYDIDGSVSFT
jgi:hypothetical protein